MVHFEEPSTNGVNGVNGHHMPSKHQFDPIEEAIAAFARGEFVVVLDNEDRENEGDLIIAAEDCTPEKIAFMIRYTSGYICAPLSVERAAALSLPQMVTNNQDHLLTAYTITVDAIAEGMTTGISARDRAVTANLLANPSATPGQFRRPGHVLPLQARPGLIRERQGHTEAGVELCRLAGKQPASIICEMVLDGEEIPGKAERSSPGMMRRDDCLAFGKKWNLKVCTIADLVTFVEAKEGPLKK